MKKLHVKHKNEGTGCVEGTVSRREISALCSLSFSLCANILWLLQLHWCRLRWTGQIDWSSPVVVAMAPVAPGNEARGVQMCSSPVCTYMDVMCVHVCQVSRWSEGLCYFNWLIHHATSPLLLRPVIWSAHRLLPFFCVLYLHKLVTGLKNVDHKWCKEKLELCLSASICSSNFRYRNTALSETLVRGKTQGKSYSISVFQQSDFCSPKVDQTHTRLDPQAGIYCRLQDQQQSQYQGFSIILQI